MGAITCPDCGAGAATKLDDTRYICSGCMSIFEPRMDDLTVPDHIGEVVGFRAWHIVETPEGVRLASTGFGGPHSRQLWEPGAVVRAICDKGHTPGDARCSCGFYAAVSREHLLSLNRYHRYDNGTPTVVGQVAMDGQVTVASLGWRAENAWPMSLEVPPPFWRYVEPLKAEYGPYNVTVALANTLTVPDTGPRWCGTCGAKIQPGKPKCHVCGSLAGDANAAGRRTTTPPIKRRR